jgi:putative RecB family exonuclease
MPWRNFLNLQVPASTPPIIRPRFSLTSDILSFRRCPRQYGFFGNDGFVPAHTVQIFYGNIIHQVLDRVHRHYSGLVEGVSKGSFPTDMEVENYFNQVENALRAHGIRAINTQLREMALRVLKVFNRIEGKTLYPRIFDTEYRLESDRDEYVLRGIVDVLAGSNISDPSSREIWDYKGTKRPNANSPQLKDYEWQMCVYAELYKQKTGVLPARAILYFINELDADPKLKTRPAKAVYEVKFTDTKIKQSLDDFHKTAMQIINCKKNQYWPNPKTPPEDETCAICDLRWNCSDSKKKYPKRYPI